MINSVFDLRHSPKAKEVTGLTFPFRLSFLEKKTGEKDGKENQVCSIEAGKTTPWVNARYKSYEKYVSTVYLSAADLQEKKLTEASRLIKELDLLNDFKEVDKTGNPEEVSRAVRLEEQQKKLNKKRSEEIILRLSELRSQVRNIDEKLNHNIEAAGDLLEVHVSNYWRGILKVISERASVPAPAYMATSYSGREKYAHNRDTALGMITEAIEKGGDRHEKE